MNSHEETPPSAPDSPPSITTATAADGADDSDTEMAQSLSTTATTPPRGNHKHNSIVDVDSASVVSEEAEAVETAPEEANPVETEECESTQVEAVPPVATLSPTSVQDIPISISHEQVKGEDAIDIQADAAKSNDKLRLTSTTTTTAPLTTTSTTSIAHKVEEQQQQPSPPSSPDRGDNSHNGNNSKLHVLADTVRRLTEQVHARDRQIRGVKEKKSRITDLEIELTAKQRLWQDTVDHNEGMTDVVYDLNVQLATREDFQVQQSIVTPNHDSSASCSSTASVNSATMHEHPLQQERDHTLIQAGELSMKLADTRAVEDELRDELQDALATIQQQYNQQNSNPYLYNTGNNNNNNNNNKYPAATQGVGHAHVPTAPASQLPSGLQSPSHSATYHAVSPDYNHTHNNSHHNSYFSWPGRTSQAQQTAGTVTKKTAAPIPAWMMGYLNHHADLTESNPEDEMSDSERSGTSPFPAHVTVHTKKPTFTAVQTATAANNANSTYTNSIPMMDHAMDHNHMDSMDTNELFPLEHFANVELTDGMEDGFAL
jgi:hypothetical protein